MAVRTAPGKPVKNGGRRSALNCPPLVVIGASAGGTMAIATLVGQLPADFPGAILVVNHMAANASTVALRKAIGAQSVLRCSEARHNDAIVAGHIYLAPPDQHMMVSNSTLILTKGARENRARPAIDPLFRSAAVTYGGAVIGVLLTGYLDDGTAGLEAIQRCGGTCVVQSPADAQYPDMPQTALTMVQVQHCVTLADMGELLCKLVNRKRSRNKPVPADLAIEAKIAERVLSDLESVEALGYQVPFNCPGCGGVLWQTNKDKQLRYRCHTGHAYTAQVLLAEQTAKMEETLWVALRMFEENRNLLMRMGKDGSASPSYLERAEQSKVHIDRIRTMLRSTEKKISKTK